VGNRPEKPLRWFFREYRFVVLLGLLGTLILAAPFFGTVDVRGRAGLPEIVLGSLFIFMLLSAATAVARSRVSMITAWCLVIPLVLFWLYDMMTGPSNVALARHPLSIVYVGYVIVLILRHLFTTDRVTVDTIASSLCVYFLLAILWAEIYTIMEIANPGSFHVTTPGVADVPLELGGGGTALALYYSLVTISTLGYGDVVPKTAPARMFAAMEAVTGQMYLAVLVARLVGMHIAHSKRWTDEPDNDDGGR